MLVHVLSLIAITLGHACLVVVAVNVLHGLGLPSKFTEPATLAALGILALATPAALWWGLQHGWPQWPWELKLYGGLCLIVGAVGLPVTTLAMQRRQPPEGVAIRSQERDVPDLAGVPDRESLIGRGRNARLLQLPGNEALRLQVSDCRIELPGLPPALDGLTLVQLTDLHMAPCIDRRYFEAIAIEVARLEPDLVLCTGDIVEHADAIDWIAPVLGRIRGRLGQFAILGNHDFLYDPRRIRMAVDAAGFADVDGRWVRLESGGATLALGGTSAPWGPRLDPSALPIADLRIVLSHTPDLFYQVARWKAVDLMFCGHNHGGQVRLPLVGSVLMPSRFSRRFDRGFFRTGRTLMYVGQGLGAKHPVRYNCPPELTRLVLRATPSRHDRAGAIRQASEVGV